MQKVLLRSLVVVLSGVFALTPVAVFAEDGGSDGSTSDTTNSTSHDGTETETETGGGRSLSDLKERLQTLKTERETEHIAKLDAVKLKVCQNRQHAIEHIMTRAVARAQNQLNLFGTIATRVEAFYVKKGKTVTNYDALVAAIADAKTKTSTDIDTLKAMPPFDCAATDPKGSAEAFKAALKTVNQDLKDYRTAVKNLIVAVKSVQGDASSSTQEDQ